MNFARARAAARLTAIVAAVALLATPSPADAQRRRNIVIIADSTGFGSGPRNEPRSQSPFHPGAVLETLLRKLEPRRDDTGTPWRRARVHNLGVGGSTSLDWVSEVPAQCDNFTRGFRLVAHACENGISWLRATPRIILPFQIDVVVVQLGLNDLLIGATAAETVDRIQQVVDYFPDIPVLVFPPLGPPAGDRGFWPLAVRMELEARGMFHNPEYPPHLPTHDGIHPTHGGYVAIAGLWMDEIRKLP